MKVIAPSILLLSLLCVVLGTHAAETFAPKPFEAEQGTDKQQDLYLNKSTTFAVSAGAGLAYGALWSAFSIAVYGKSVTNPTALKLQSINAALPCLLFGPLYPLAQLIKKRCQSYSQKKVSSKMVWAGMMSGFLATTVATRLYLESRPLAHH